MALISLHFFRAQWLSLSQYLSKLTGGLWGYIQSGITTSLSFTSVGRRTAKRIVSVDEYFRQLDRTTFPAHPLTNKQEEDSIEEFFSSIDRAAVCNLASRHNDGKSCEIIDKQNGSFNICFIVLFKDEDVRWVVRIPIEPAVSNAWAKVVSEVTTLRYIKSNTTIPCPQVYAYGKDTTLVKDTSTPFMIMEFIHGQQLHTRTFIEASELQRKNLYADLINILAQLRKLEFPAVGSLMPSIDTLANDETKPVLGPLLSMPVNVFETESQKTVPAIVSASTRQFVDSCRDILVGTYLIPTEELSHEHAKREIFALESVLKEIERHIDFEDGTFILAHPDLRCGNIIVDDMFHILGVIDWEFAGTVPRHLSLPPPWITGHEPDTRIMVTGISGNKVWPEFLTVLQDMQKTSPSVAQLWRDWKADEENAVQNNGHVLTLAPLVRNLQRPSSLTKLYYPSTFQRLYGSGTDEDTIVNGFFEDENNQNLAAQAVLQVQDSERYTSYLKDNNLLVPDEQSLRIKEWRERAKALLEKLRIEDENKEKEKDGENE